MKLKVGGTHRLHVLRINLSAARRLRRNKRPQSTTRFAIEFPAFFSSTGSWQLNRFQCPTRRRKTFVAIAPSDKCSSRPASCRRASLLLQHFSHGSLGYAPPINRAVAQAFEENPRKPLRSVQTHSYSLFSLLVELCRYERTTAAVRSTGDKHRSVTQNRRGMRLSRCSQATCGRESSSDRVIDLRRCRAVGPIVAAAADDSLVRSGSVKCLDSANPTGYRDTPVVWTTGVSSGFPQPRPPQRRSSLLSDSGASPS